MVSNSHTHTPTHTARFDSGKVIDVCDCGATREYDRNQPPPNTWHTCALCTHSYGLPQTKAKTL